MLVELVESGRGEDLIVAARDETALVQRAASDSHQSIMRRAVMWVGWNREKRSQMVVERSGHSRGLVCVGDVAGCGEMSEPGGPCRATGRALGDLSGCGSAEVAM